MKTIKYTLLLSATLCSLNATDIKPIDNYFIGVGLNYNSLSVNKKNIAGDISLINKLDDSTSSLNLQAGTRMKNYLISANYEVLNLNEVDMNTLYLSVDYEFERYLNVDPFIGVSLGMSNLQWNTDPLTNSKSSDVKLSSLMYGIQAGMSYPLNDNWSIYTTFSYQKLDFATTLTDTPNKAEINHEDKTSVGVGVKWAF